LDNTLIQAERGAEKFVNNRFLIHNLLLSPTSQHSELITHNLTRAAKRDVNSVDNDWLITLV